ncbi:hypothetical protein [Streptomyces sp. NBC_01304]|uniref:hypothetical protein n=1 Tax=Streptomyces sp. NBC_01304 TaxID=2903818 RepID=UPI002E1450D4|nr:hypothetical protein OG430_05660 [Streptomyces sp. NBC_01304]
MRVTCRTLRSSVIAAGVVAGLSLSTTAAFADTPAAPDSGQEQVRPGTDNQGQDQDQVLPGGDEQSKEPKKDEGDQTPKPGGDEWKSLGARQLAGGITADVRVKASANSAAATLAKGGQQLGTLEASGSPASKVVDGYTVTLSPSGDVSAQKNNTGVPGGWEDKGTQDLGDGWSAAVQVNASARSAKADIALDGSVQGALKAEGKSASTKINDITFTLTTDGSVSKKNDETPKPDQRDFVREYTNLGGSGFDAKVYKTKAGFEADMFAKDPSSGRYVQWDTLKQSGDKPATGQHNGAHFALDADGTMKGWVDSDPVVPGGWESKGTQDLGSGWSANVQLNASARIAKAQISLNNAAKGSLQTEPGKSASKVIDGCTFTLNSDGSITKKKNETPKPGRTFVREYTNLGGSGFDAKVYKTKAGFEADLIGKATDSGNLVVWDTLKQSGKQPAYGQHNGAHFVLNPDGTMKGWVEGSTDGGKKDRIVPKGGVKAGSEGATAEPDETALIAAGGSMAAAGAAALGFAMLRRGRKND